MNLKRSPILSPAVVHWTCAGKLIRRNPERLAVKAREPNPELGAELMVDGGWAGW